MVQQKIHDPSSEYAQDINMTWVLACLISPHYLQNDNQADQILNIPI